MLIEVFFIVDIIAARDGAALKLIGAGAIAGADAFTNLYALKAAALRIKGNRQTITQGGGIIQHQQMRCAQRLCKMRANTHA